MVVDVVVGVAMGVVVGVVIGVVMGVAVGVVVVDVVVGVGRNCSYSWRVLQSLPLTQHISISPLSPRYF